MAEVPRRLWVAVIVGTLAVVVLLALGFWALARDDEVVLRIDDWSMTRSELDQRLGDVVGNSLYVQVRQEQDVPLAVPDDGESWDPALVSEVLNDEVRFRLAAIALARRGGEVTITDREAARAQLAEALVGGAVLEGGESATLDAVLSQFGDSRMAYEDGTATVWALRRVLAAELGAPADSGEVSARVFEVLAETAATVDVEVDPDLGTWDAASAKVVVRGGSVGGLDPVEEDAPDAGDDAGPIGETGDTAPAVVGPPSAGGDGP